MSQSNFSLPQRQSSKGLLLIFLVESKKMVKAWWPALIYPLVKVSGEQKWTTILLILGGILLLTLIHSILTYRFYKFHLDSSIFVLNKGYIRKQNLSIPLERIQNVRTTQSVLQKIFRVMGLEIDTAGTSQKELKIVALEQADAVELARLLMEHVKNTNQEGEGETIVTQETEFLRLSNLDLLKIGLSQNHIKAALLIVAFGFQIFEQLEDFFEEKAKAYSNEVLEYIGSSGWLIGLSLLIGFILFSFIFSLLRTLILFYDLRMHKSARAYRIVSGLLNRKNLLIPFDKILQLDWETGPLKKLFGIYKINIRQATGDEMKQAQSVEIPGCLTPHLEQIKADLFQHDSPDEQANIYAHPSFFNRNWFYAGWIPAILLTPLYISSLYYLGIGISWLILMIFYARLKQGKTYFRINQGQIQSSSGAISHTMKQMRFHLVQQLEIQQSIFQKRRGLANLRISNASGSIKIRYIDYSMAKKLQDYLLHYAETSNEAWM